MKSISNHYMFSFSCMFYLINLLPHNESATKMPVNSRPLSLYHVYLRVHLCHCVLSLFYFELVTLVPLLPSQMKVKLSVAEGHLCNMGRMIEEMESKLRNSLDQVILSPQYFISLKFSRFNFRNEIIQCGGIPNRSTLGKQKRWFAPCGHPQKWCL